jgi:hypothetical protein
VEGRVPPSVRWRRPSSKKYPPEWEFGPPTLPPPDRRWPRAIGWVLVGLLLVPGGAVSVWAVGDALTLDPSAPQLAVSSTGEQIVSLCPPRSGSNCGAGFSAYGFQGVSFVAPGDLWVVSGETPIKELGGSIRTIFSTLTPQNCSVDAQYYPGTGSYIFLQCIGMTTSVLYEYAWGTGQIARQIPLNPNDGVSGAFAFDFTHDVLFSTAKGSAPVVLTTLDLAYDSPPTEVSLPMASPYGPICFDNWTGGILVDDNSSRSLDEVDPATGALLRQVPLRGVVSSMSTDPSGDRIYLATDENGGQLGNVTVLNASSLTPVHTYGGLLAGRPIQSIVDAQDNQLLLSVFPWGVGFLDLDSGRFLGPFGASGFTYPMAYDSASSTLGALSSDDASGMDVQVAFFNLSHAPDPGIPLGGVPLVGGALPWVVVAAGIAIWAPLSGRYLLRKRVEIRASS